MQNKDKMETIEYKKLPTAGKLFLKATLLSFVIAVIMLFVTAIGIAIWGFNKANNFAKQADTNLTELKDTIQESLETTPIATNSKKNILLLGVDTLNTRPNNPALTDTIMLISFDLKTGQVSTLSLPRDLWSEEYQTRINALYFYGKDKIPEKPEEFATQTISKLTGVPIHHTIILSLNTVADIIDILGGIEIDVQQGFVDSKFPRPDVDVTKVTNPELLYKTVEFKKGKQLMNSEQALEFIRSRKASNDQGTDNARSSRQQQVIDALINSIQALNPLKDTEKLAKLYKYYNQHFADQLSIQELITTLKTVLPIKEEVTFNKSLLSIYPENKFGVITNPPTYKYHGEWVYEITNLANFKEEVQTKLNLK